MNYTTEYEYKQISTKNIVIDPMYQRDLKPQKVSQIVADFDPRLLNAPKVSFRDGKYFCFDGQHSIAGVKARVGGRDCVIECKVFYGLTWYDEAHLFLLQNGHATGVEVNAKYRTLMNMGDPDVKKMVLLSEKLGIRIDFTRSKGQNKIIALSTLFKVFSNRKTDREFTDLLFVLKSAWGGIPESYSGEILRGVSLFQKTYDGQFKQKILVEKLGRTSPTAIIREAKVSIATGDRKYARQILGAYNSGASANRLPDLL